MLKANIFGYDKLGETVYSLRLRNSNGMIVDLISYGATIQNILLPSISGDYVDVCLGFKDMDGYLSSSNPYIGATIGRVCNRIKDGKFSLGGHDFTLLKNDNQNSIHGGYKGFDKHVWKIHKYIQNVAVFSHISLDGDEGYPGTVSVTAKFELNDMNELKITYSAESEKDTPINLTNHAYFNLGGEGSGADELYEHNVTIYANRYTPVNEETKIPTGDIASLHGSPFNLLQNSKLGSKIKKCPEGENAGFDHNYVLESNEIKLAAQVSHPSGITMECWTNQKGLQFYTGNYLGNDSNLLGKSGKAYVKHGGFCLETQNYPNAINQHNFPNCILKPGEKYESVSIYKFTF